MNIMKKYILLSIAAVAALLFTSCNNYLDLTPTNETTDKTVFANKDYVDMTVTRFYHFFDAMGQFDVGQFSG